MRFNDLQRVGQYEGSDGLQAMLAAEGYVARQRQMSEAHRARVDNFARLFGDVVAGREDSFLLKEALFPQHDYAVMEIAKRYPGVLRLNETMSVTDFANYLTVDVLDRMLYGYWNIDNIPNRVLTKFEPLRDFRTVKRFEIDGAVKPFSKQGSPADPPDQRALSPVDPITFAPDLYQGMMSINWRAIVNDDLGIFNDLVQRLSSSWNLTVWKAITSLYVDANGPHASLYTAGFKNQIITANGASVSNPPLDFQGLIDADTVLAKMLNPDGQPFVHTGTKYLWYGPKLETTAKALMAALAADISVGGGTTNANGFPSQRLRVNANYVTGGLVPVLDKYIPLIATSAAGNIKDTMWGITYEPAVQPRPSTVFGQLRGFDTPQLFQKVPNTQRAGGGVDPSMGDFLTMDTDYKAIAVFGGTQVDGRSTVASTGAGS
jgi:hypothetical protein